MLTDIPIESCDDEGEYGINRCEFSKFLGDVILKYNEKESIVIGLSGEWGSGKTSIINMALDHIRKIKTATQEDKPVIIRFNPWNYSDQNQLIIQFFNELIITFESLGFGKKFVNDVKSYASKLTITAGVLVGGLIRPGTTKIYLDFFKSGKSENETLEDLRKDLDKSLLKQKRKIIIVIEDIDRLNSIEMRQTFQLVKILANFPNTLYLLEFDKNLVVKSLEDDIHKDYSFEYLEKIVQVIYEVPKLTELEIELIVNYEISKLIGDYLKELNKDTWEIYYQEGLNKLFKDIRGIKRYINTLKLSFELLKDEVRLEDLFAITAIQIFLPEVYNSIKNNKRLFAYRLEDITRNLHELNQQKEKYQKIFDEFLKNGADSKNISEEELKNLLRSLFPIVGYVYGNSSDPPHYELFSICAPHAFDTYFKLSVPEGLISSKEFKGLISKSNNFNNFGESLVQYDKDGKIKKILEYLEVYYRTYRSTIPLENIESMITALMNKGDLFTPNDLNPLEKSTLIHINRLINILLNYVSDNEKLEIIKRAIQNTNESIVTICHYVDYLEKKQADYSNFISKKTLQELKKIVCGKIEQHANSGSLIDNYDPFAVLCCWNEWCDKTEMESYLDNLMSKNDEFIGLLRKIIRRNYLKDSIEKIINLKKLESKIYSLKKSSEFENLGEKDQKDIISFLEYISE